ncbi:MAG: PABP-interacting PAM2 motif-containing protein [Verrucomicrobia bacterium]|nr:PABP-interacting PAM2 motif-containing protein [Verrucomicrobiota bacterium]
MSHPIESNKNYVVLSPDQFSTILDGIQIRSKEHERCLGIFWTHANRELEKLFLENESLKAKVQNLEQTLATQGDQIGRIYYNQQILGVQQLFLLEKIQKTTSELRILKQRNASDSSLDSSCGFKFPSTSLNPNAREFVPSFSKK